MVLDEVDVREIDWVLNVCLFCRKVVSRKEVMKSGCRIICVVLWLGDYSRFVVYLI